MASRSRRKARVSALQALYENEVGKTSPRAAIEAVLQEVEVAGELAEYAKRLVFGVKDEQRELDATIAKHLKDYDFGRLAAIDRNLLRIAAYELLFVPEIPPAVTIDEAVEIAKRYSTSESGRFVNGVLGQLLLTSPKANWNPDDAPAEYVEADEDGPAIPEVEELDVTPDDEAFRVAKRIGGWKLKSDDLESS